MKITLHGNETTDPYRVPCQFECQDDSLPGGDEGLVRAGVDAILAVIELKVRPPTPDMKYPKLQHTSDITLRIFFL